MTKYKPSEKRDASLPVLDCFGCGVCCLHMGYPAFNLPNEILRGDISSHPKQVGDDSATVPGEVAARDLERWRAMPETLRNELMEVIRNYRAPEQGLDGACVWLDTETRLCGHHEHRPQVCRDFEIGSPKCHEWREHYSDLVNLES